MSTKLSGLGKQWGKAYEIDKASDSYPQKLLALKKPPEKVYCLGNVDLVKGMSLGIVGSRAISDYGTLLMKKIVPVLCNHGLCIVSGFMYGVDALAHRIALENNAPTIAVMPCGVDVIHPAFQSDLYYDILRNDGLVISELPPGFLPQKWTFPRRNRIVSALSDSLFVAEAGEKSGALITASFSFEMKKKVFCLPQSVNAKSSLGIVEVLNDGGIAIATARDILRHLNIMTNVHRYADSAGVVADPLSAQKSKVLSSLMSQGSLTIDMLCKQLSLPPSVVTPLVYDLVIAGMVYESEGVLYAN